MPESYLENALVKLARQVVAFDEASLMDLWEKYAEVVRRFEPTRRWEEAALIFGLIQSVRMKNQLFNYNLSASRSGVPGPGLGLDLLNLSAPEPRSRPAGAEPAPEPAPAAAKPAGRGSARQGKPKAGKLIPLRPGKD
ncbi:MAG: hypothetical protein CVU73_08470 [Deltaproteobacteria bacterium HGW-Deltaproteobacteria-8]|jgi:hypothetical protein|nr:MAG: hypothetical protein CVU73_08470 [Deltaproteobacteria bacterium HGW-Deltaproteobacteria-8]